MKGFFKQLRRSRVVLLCLGCVMFSVQSWAHDDEDKILTRTTDEKNTIEKKQKCEGQCKVSDLSQAQKNNHKQYERNSIKSDKQHSKMSNMPSSMTEMDHKQMKMPDHVGEKTNQN